MKITSIFITVIVCATLVAGCKKKDKVNPANNNNSSNNNNNNNNDTSSKSKTALLISGKWQMTHYTESWTDSSGNHTTDVFGEARACERDNFTVFNTDDKMTVDEGSTKCDPSDAQTYDLTWQLLNNDSQIKMDGKDSSNPTVADIITLNSSTLSIKVVYEESGTEFTNDISYKNIK